MTRWMGWLFKAAIGFGVLLVLFVVGSFFLIRHFLSPEKIRPLVESKLSVAIGQPVKLGDMGISVFPTPGIHAEKLFVGDPLAPSLAVASLRIVPSLPPLLSGKVVIDRVDLKGLDIALRRTRKGEWLIPYNPPKEEASQEADDKAAANGETRFTLRTIRILDGTFRLVDEVPPGGGAPREVAALRDIEGVISPTPQGVEVETLTARFLKTKLAGTASVTADQTRLKLSSPSIASEDLPQILAFLGSAPIQGLSIAGAAPFEMEMTIPQKGSMSAAGRFEAAKLTLNTLEITQLKTPFKVERDVATLSPLTFNAYGGTQKGTVTLAFSKDPMGYSVKTDLDHVDVNQALSANTSAKNVLLGTGKVSAFVKGAGFDEGALKSRLNGNASIAIRDGVIKDLPLLAKINQSLKITEGNEKDTRFERLDGTFDIGSGKAHTEDLKLKAGELGVKLKGDVRFDMTLDFKGTATFSKAKTKELQHKLHELKGFISEQGEMEIPLTISGPVSNPSVNIDLRKAVEKAVKKEVKKTLQKELMKIFGK